MRALVVPFALLATACGPEIVSGAYLCGEDASCPEDQVCSGDNITCVLPALAKPFSCLPEVETEPDDTAQNAYLIATPDCVSVPAVLDSCMLSEDSADWVKFQTPSVCAGVSVDARITFPIAFQRLSLELYNLDTDELLATDTACVAGGGEAGEDLRCLQTNLTAGTSYGIQVQPTGDGDCDGDCAYNRYTLRVQLAAPR